ncbi:hypothetical protein MUK42_14817 [Musa troglodytarum]|uniref:Uncharacterized protein n=1 Tax=Musa troglodytarum TaxID=320322 RepID=A0A9E7LAJ9_9LILI|nr:hypothetical protein MUK42_14817 [Musa troglodytarum]
MQLGGNWAIHHRHDTWAHPVTHHPILDDHVTSFTARHHPPREGLLPVPSVRSSRLGEYTNLKRTVSGHSYDLRDTVRALLPPPPPPLSQFFTGRG